MSTRPLLKPFSVVTNGDMSGNITSAPTILLQLTTGSYGYSWSGTAPVGTISFQGSIDYSLNADGSVNNAGHWTTMNVTYNGSSVSSVPLSGNTGNGLIDWETGIYAIRTVYTRTSGTGTLQVMINSKVK